MERGQFEKDVKELSELINTDVNAAKKFFHNKTQDLKLWEAVALKGMAIKLSRNSTKR